MVLHNFESVSIQGVWEGSKSEVLERTPQFKLQVGGMTG